MSNNLSPADIQAILDALAPADPGAVYLFGSLARGEARPQSDVDLGILPRRSLSGIELFQLREDLAQRLGRAVDLVSLPSASEALKIQVIQTGIPLQIADPRSREVFEMYAFSDYARLNEERQPVIESMERTGSFYEL